MNDTRAISRRGALGLLVLSGALAAGCNQKKALSCNDTTGLAPADAQMRTMQAYTDQAPQQDKMCNNCQLFQPTAPEQCGACTVLKGPVSPRGYCKLWVLKQS